MPAKVFVGNLSSSVTDHKVRTLFSKYGPVEKVSLVTDRDSGRPKGFVEMSSGADEAIQALHNSSFDGKIIEVRLADLLSESGQ